MTYCDDGRTLSYPLTKNKCVSNVQLDNTLISEIPSGLWNKINDFFCFTHQAEALKCFHQLFHLPEGTTADNVKMLFERLQELAHPKDVDNIQISQGGSNHFSLTDKGGKDMLSIVFADDYVVTTWGRITYFDEKGCAHSSPLT
ncbi:hypothetical protein [Morganella morganii]|uniref:hypothetical protein n=1 Tax=Morganella TaxID=581 RepID=UPI00370C4E89